MKDEDPNPFQRRVAALLFSAGAALLSASAAAQTAVAPPSPAGHPPAAQNKDALTRPAKPAKPAKPVKRVDINKAGRAELKTLQGVGDAEADKIIAARPFLTKADLVTKGILPEGIYVAIKDRIVASQSPQAVKSLSKK